MIYQAKIEKNKFAEFKKLKNGMPLGYRVGKWIEHLSSTQRFAKFFKDFPKENEIIYRVVGAKNEAHPLKVVVEEDAWLEFRTLAGKRGMSGNYALNYVIAQYVKNKGAELFDVKISV